MKNLFTSKIKGVWIAGMMLPLAVAAQLQPDFYAAFEGDLVSRVEGVTVEPVKSAQITFVDGVRGQAILTGPAGRGSNRGYVEYPAADLLAGPEGTIMFWMQPTAPTAEEMTYYNLFYGYTDSSQEASADQRLRMFLHSGLKVYQKNGTDPILTRLALGWLWPQGDWCHVAFSWNEKGETKLYVDGLPYAHGRGPARIMRSHKLADITLQEIKSLLLGTPQGKQASGAGMAFDELKIFSKTLSNQEVSAEFRQVVPVDLVVNRRFIRANEAEKSELKVWPGGSMELPQVGVLVPTPFELSMKLELHTAAGQVVKQKTVPVTVDGRQTLELDVGSLSEGAYGFVCSFSFEGTQYRKTFLIESYAQKPAPVVSNEPMELGEAIGRLDCSSTGFGYVEDGRATVVDSPELGTYREAGSKKEDRFSFEMEFPNADGSPVLLEIEWPDDKPRSMGLYMYVESKNPKHRDRLGGGIQSGMEYPVSGKMQTTRYLFYPLKTRYLFEARTLVDDYPAAVASITIRPLIGRLPKLPILLPEGEPQRFLGHMDEDQTFEVPMNWRGDYPKRVKKRYTVDALETLMDFFDYTGQNTLSYPFIRYNYTYQDLPGRFESVGLQTKGWQQLMLDLFDRRGMKLFATCSAYGLPHDMLAPDPNEDEYILRDRSGKILKIVRGGVKVNPVHPETRRRFLQLFEGVIAEAGDHPSFGGIDLWLLPKKAAWAFGSLEYGYGDFTVNLFEKETGIRLGVNAGSPGRFEKRYQILTGKYRKEWLQWRAQKSTELVGALDEMLRAARPDATLYISVGGWGRKETVLLMDADDFNFITYFYEDFGIDFTGLAGLPSVSLVAQRQPSWRRWQLHRDNQASMADEILWDPSKFAVFRKTRKAGSVSYQRYFESFNESLKNDTYSSYFQNADVKPADRFFQMELVQSLAATDAQTLLIGAQPMGMAGRMAQSREFARAYRALPAGAFIDVTGPQDPVVVRYLKTEHGTYLYAANLNFFDWDGAVSFTSLPEEAIDLSTGKPISLARGILPIALKPFELRSFRLDSSAIPQEWRVRVSPEAEAWYTQKLADLVQQISELDARSAKEFMPLIRQLQAAIKDKAFAEAHRLVFSKRVMTLPALLEQGRKGDLKKR